VHLLGEGLERLRVLGAEEGGAGCSGKGGWGMLAGLSAGVLPGDGFPPPKVSLSRPASDDSAGDASSEASGSSASGESTARRFPFLISARNAFACLTRYSKTASGVSMWRSAFPVSGFMGTKLHFSFLTKHSWHAPVGSVTHSTCLAMHL
jgi:hypothetical protein